MSDDKNNGNNTSGPENQATNGNNSTVNVEAEQGAETVSTSAKEAAGANPADVKAENGSSASAKVAEEAGKSTGETLKDTAQKAKDEGPGFIERIKSIGNKERYSTNIVENFKESTTTRNAMRSGCIALGAVLGAGAMKNIQRDEDGDRHTVTALFQGGAAMALIAGALLRKPGMQTSV